MTIFWPKYLKTQRSSLIYLIFWVKPFALLSKCCKLWINQPNLMVRQKFQVKSSIGQKIVTKFKYVYHSITCWPLCFLFWFFLAVPSRNIFSDAYYVYCTSVMYLIPHNAIFLRKVPMDLNPSKLHLSIFHRKHSPKINYFSKRKWKDSFLAKPKKNSFIKNKSQEQFLPQLVHWLVCGIFVKNVFETYLNFRYHWVKKSE